ncbi:hypothetical protein E4U46_007910 [Claviceps purpurea]|nr:hypothetical protein E4U46_007910 [Claviceps purpurea]
MLQNFQFVEHYGLYRKLPAKLAKLFARQMSDAARGQGLDFLAANDMGHGHHRSIIYTLETSLSSCLVFMLSKKNLEDFIARLGDRVTGAVTKLDDGP